MVAGLVMACIEEKDRIQMFLGESDEDSRGRWNGVLSSQVTKKQRTRKIHMKTMLLMNLKVEEEFFDKYQFIAARENFIKAESKLKYSDLKERSKLFIRIVEFYDSWDKFNDEQKLVKEKQYSRVCW